MKFSEFSLNENLMRGIDDANFTDCLPVQERTYEHALKGIDVMVQSQTGSGKTAAFLVSIYQLFTEDTYKHQKRALIIAPTRELAVQIDDEAKILGAHLPFRTGCFYGGVGYERQEHLIKKGVDIIIGTPGRLIDLNQSKTLDFSDIGILIIDEADRLFDMGFLPDLRRMLKKLPDINHRQTMLFSATLSDRVQKLASEYMNNPVAIDVAPESITVETVTQELYHVAKEEKMKLLIGLLKKENPSSALIFTNMKTRAAEVARRLSLNGIGCEYIIGDLPQTKRLKIINEIKSGAIRILVATDVAARGLHINDLDLVVNYDLPEDPEAYVHRIGRTARAGKSGKAITIVCERYLYGLEAIESLINIKIPVAFAKEEDYAEDKSSSVRIHDDRRGQGRDKRNERSGAPRTAGKFTSDRKPRHLDKAGHPEKPAHLEKAKPERQHAAPDGQAAAPRKKWKRADHLPEHKRQAEASVPPARDSSRDEEKKQKRKSAIRKQPSEDRMEYYKKKYGENFKSYTEPKKRKGRKLIEAIKGIFSRKKAEKKA